MISSIFNRNSIGTAVLVLRWFGNIIMVIAVGIYAFIVTMPCASCGNWDLFVVPVTLIAIPVLSLIIAINWPVIAAEALVAVAILNGWYLFSNNIWVTMLYALPAFIAGICFLIAGIYSSIEKRYEYKLREKQGNKEPLTPGGESAF